MKAWRKAAQGRTAAKVLQKLVKQDQERCGVLGSYITYTGFKIKELKKKYGAVRALQFLRNNRWVKGNCWAW